MKRMARSKGTPSRLLWPGLPPRIALGFGAALLSLAAASGASYVALDPRKAASVLLRHTAEAQQTIEELEAAVLVSDVALRAYVEDRAPRHRELFLRASAKLLPALANLQRISEQHPEQRSRITRIAAELDAVRWAQARISGLLTIGDINGARALETASPEREAIEHAIAMLGQIAEDERLAHEGREAAWRRTVVVSNSLFVAAVVVLLVLILLGARLVRDDIASREAARAERERALVVQQRLMAVVSHDLRNPLGAILAAGSGLARLELPPRAEPMARRIVSAGRRMERLIRDLLAGAACRAAAPSRSPPARPICARSVSGWRTSSGAARETRWSSSARVTPARPSIPSAWSRWSATCSRTRSGMRRPEPPCSCGRWGLGTRSGLEVHDEGPGIPPDAQARVFDPFQQGPQGYAGGLGLGLFIVRAVVEAHGGNVQLASTPGKTVFVVRLPRPTAPQRAGDGGIG